MSEEMVRVPKTLPEGLVEEFDEVLFDLCRQDDYAGLYAELVKRVAERPTPNT